ncbi:hypothetical protein HO173_007067 [Letharia columbiana]|uniref:Uncharacterized protein n=1 Tax=Letharia columbiana TaxID=112416 RepID=A0A8H6FUA0_9LECA|nr:uncharacterized protein HO173_007067 [Letharia columbiana]KAF6234847.1 hypothetical protein HO173_007067 [Letharia columbiana]
MCLSRTNQSQGQEAAKDSSGGKSWSRAREERRAGDNFSIALRDPLSTNDVERKVAESSAQELVIDKDPHEVVRYCLPESAQVAIVQHSEVARFQMELIGERGGVVVFAPLRRCFVCRPCFWLVP